jgi:uncharacterized protein YndB with AHSA1/START domain
MPEPRFVYVTYIRTTREQLWKALTTPEFSRQYWWGREVESDFAVGSPIRYTYEQGAELDIEGTVRGAEEPERLSYTFTDPGVRERGEPASTVTFLIEEAEGFEGVVRLTVTHEDFAPNSPTLEGVSKGWPDILASLKTLLETGAPLAYA